MALPSVRGWILNLEKCTGYMNSAAAQAPELYLNGGRRHAGARLHRRAAHPLLRARAARRGQAARRPGHALGLRPRRHPRAAGRRLPLPRHADRGNAVGAEQEQGKG